MTSATPATSAGRAIGKATAQNDPPAVRPSVRATSKRAHRLLNEARPRGQIDVGVEHELKTTRWRRQMSARPE